MSNPNPFLMQHVAFILLCKISPSWITIYKLFLFYSNTWRDPQLERRGLLVSKGEGGWRLVKRAVIKPLHSPKPGFTNYRGQGKGKVTLGHQGSFSFTVPHSPLFLRFCFFVFCRFITSGFHHFVWSWQNKQTLSLLFVIDKGFDSVISCRDAQRYSNHDCRQSWRK